MVKTSIPAWWIAAYWANPWAYITQVGGWRARRAAWATPQAQGSGRSQSIHCALHVLATVRIHPARERSPPLSQALAVNEFTGPSWSYPYNASEPAGPTMGEVILDFRGFGTE